MRIWSLHPKYLDTKGLVALWREALLAKKVLEGSTNGYKNHPQLDRFKSSKFSLEIINQYLSEVFREAQLRNFSFNKSKIDWDFEQHNLSVTNEQLKFERNHLLKKLKKRNPKSHEILYSNSLIDQHPLFKVVVGKVEPWEIR